LLGDTNFNKRVMMKLTFTGTISVPKKSLISQAMEKNDSITVSDLLEILGYQKEHRKFIIVTGDNRRLDHQEKISNYSEIDLTVTVGGG
jgi:sulfur carrier protein ThiS